MKDGRPCQGGGRAGGQVHGHPGRPWRFSPSADRRSGSPVGICLRAGLLAEAQRIIEARMKRW